MRRLGWRLPPNFGKVIGGCDAMYYVVWTYMFQYTKLCRDIKMCIQKLYLKENDQRIIEE